MLRCYLVIVSSLSVYHGTIIMKNFEDVRKDLARENPELFISLEIVGKRIAARDRKELSQRELSRLSNVPQKKQLAEWKVGKIYQSWLLY